MNGDGKLENQLNLALEMGEEERSKSLDLNVGYHPEGKIWEVIFQYVGDLNVLELPGEIEIERLSNGYAIAFVPEYMLEDFSALPQIVYIEKPKSLLLEQERGIAVSCLLSVKTSPLSLSGKGVYTAVIDTGIDIFHSDFIDAQGNTRIASLWDQTIPGNPPEGFAVGTVYNQEEINRAIHEQNGIKIVPSTDRSGHGTHVASICAGNRGVASESELIVVKLGSTDERGFPRTTQLMTALEYVVDFAEKEGRPIAVNISYGNNYGDHRGSSLLETFITQISGKWKNTICIGTGNEGDTGRHRRGKLENRMEEILFDIAPYEPNMNLQLWKHFVDDFGIILISPSGMAHQIQKQPGKAQYQYGTTRVYVYYGLPTPYNQWQEIYFSFIPSGSQIESGQWKLQILPERIVNGNYYLWLPVSNGTNPQTRFLEPSKTLTLTIPSTADKIIAVGAYHVQYNSYAGFSGRGDEILCVEKPDLVAPGVGILGAAPGGGETVMSGTSMATPFVTGSAALLMEWGIINGNDPYLYGEKVKAYFHRGAAPMEGFTVYPNSQVGYGKLCVRNSIPE